VAKIWTEPLDPARHVDHFHAGSALPAFIRKGSKRDRVLAALRASLALYDRAQ